MKIELCPLLVFKKLVYLIFILFCANLLGVISIFYFDIDINIDVDNIFVHGLVRLFDFSTEKNIPTLYSSITLVLASLILFTISLAHKKNNASWIPWFGLSIIFLFLGIDEISSIHERLATPTRELLNTSGFFYFAWVIPYGLILFIFLISYFKFLMNLPKKIMQLFVLSGVIFVTGSIGFEMIGGREAELFGMNSLAYSLYYTCEETLEMLGVAIFIFSLLTYIVDNFESPSIVISKDNELNKN